MEQPNILVVDDSISNLLLLKDILTGYNYKVTTESEGENVHNILKNQPTDLILLDIMMPKVDGFEVCRRIKKDQTTKDIPIIFLTAKVDEESLLKGFELGGVDYIKKPFLISELMARVKTHLQLRYAEAQLKETNQRMLSVIIQTEEKERARFAKDVHDGLGAYFSSLNTYLNLLSHGKMTTEELPAVYLEMKELVDEAVQESKNISNNITPDIISNFGLAAAVKNLCDKISPNQNPKIIFEVSENFVEPSTKENKTAIYRIINELLNNALKHSKAQNITIKFSQNDNQTNIVYNDDGCGFDKNEVIQRIKNKPYSGISNIYGRVSALNGNLELITSPNNGVKLNITINKN